MPDFAHRRVTPNERGEGFLCIPTELKHFFEEMEGEVPLFFERNRLTLEYSPEYNCLCNLSSLYDEYDIKVNELLWLCFFEDNLNIGRCFKDGKVDKYRLPYGDESVEVEDELLMIQEEMTAITHHRSAKLSNHIKGNIAEDRIKEYILFHSENRLTVFKPILDDNGIDLIVMQKGNFNPIYLQIKSRYTDPGEDGTFLQISAKTFHAHPSFFIVGVNFDHDSLEIIDDILLIPSSIADEHARDDDNNSNKRILDVSFKKENSNSWHPYLTPKNELAIALLNKMKK